jgi:uncharacterized protein RhaS with RHS repeats
MNSVRKILTPALLCLPLILISHQNACGYYDPGAQRWINRDPIGERGGANLYEVLHNNPISTLDPLGRSVLDDLCDPNSKNRLTPRQKDEAPQDNRTPEQKKKDLEKCQDDCMASYDEDSEFCRSLRTSRSRNYCWRQAAKRLAKCMHDCRLNNT